MEIKILIAIVLALILLYNVYPDFFSQMLNTLSIQKAEGFEQVQHSQKSSVDVDEDLNIPVRINNATYGDNYFLDDGQNGEMGLHSTMCSKSCCSPQYPTPFSIPVDQMVCESGDDYIPSNYTCNNGWQDTGCLCMTKEQATFLASRGGNM